jgi:hypothetical protein
MKNIQLALAAAFLLAPAASYADQKFACAVFHWVRVPSVGSSEITLSAIVVRNLDLHHQLTIRRLTIRDGFGVVVHDSGPAVGTPLPLNRDFTPPLDITYVPPGASYYNHTVNIWGNNGVPPTDSLGRNPAGTHMTAIVQVSAQGSFLIRSTGVTRERVPINTPNGVGFTEGEERSRSAADCVQLDD